MKYYAYDVSKLRKATELLTRSVSLRINLKCGHSNESYPVLHFCVVAVYDKEQVFITF